MQCHHIPVAKAVAWFEDPAAAAAATGTFEVSSEVPDVAYVEPLTRRRLSRLARAVLHCAGRCQGEPGDLKIVVASRHGEVARTLSLLEDLAASSELSPTAFSLSVHNATAGLLSIVRRNHSPISAVGAGEETFGWGLLDAYAMYAAAPGEPVLYLYGDDALPTALAGFSDNTDGLVAIGLLVAREATRTLEVTVGGSTGHPDACSLPVRFTSASDTGEWSGGRTRWAWRWQEAGVPNVH